MNREKKTKGWEGRSKEGVSRGRLHVRYVQVVLRKEKESRIPGSC